ncbi:hypothetical protein GGX14DRAFT_481427 [Mycena pura]|uniref:Uncharacterized protein n=1 Tax=Mycena pura TaxID=153505 RepID=A0AAD6UP10_9AGAR|nr:hypothetical protein GGX14DRAFT_481427 [Mycena pura]
MFSGTDLVAFVAAFRRLADGRLTSLLPLPPPPPPKVNAREVISGDDGAALYDGEPKPGQGAVRCSPLFTEGAAELFRCRDAAHEAARGAATAIAIAADTGGIAVASRVADRGGRALLAAPGRARGGLDAQRRARQNRAMCVSKHISTTTPEFSTIRNEPGLVAKACTVSTFTVGNANGHLARTFCAEGGRDRRGRDDPRQKHESQRVCVLIKTSRNF